MPERLKLRPAAEHFVFLQNVTEHLNSIWPTTENVGVKNTTLFRFSLMLHKQ
jgi:hypothetical protein